MDAHYSSFAEPLITRILTKSSRLSVHIVLFLLTLLTTTIMGVVWQNDTDLMNLEKGIAYSLSLLFILSCHEFGHYFAAMYHKVSATLPYFIPFPPIALPGFGTMGAVIRMREPIRTRKALFDIGIAGPIAGFIASLFILIWGFSHLPGKEFILSLHPDYNFDLNSIPNLTPGNSLRFGSTLLYDFLAKIIPPAGSYVPPMSEMYHYPMLITGWFGLFITAMNLLPVGQLDGGHIAYAMFGKKHALISRMVAAVVGASGILGILPSIMMLVGLEVQAERFLLNYPFWDQIFWAGWFFWALVILILIKVDHPPIEDAEELSPGRTVLGWFALLMFIFSISPVPFFMF